MSCEGHRNKYFEHLAAHVEGVDTKELDRIYQAASNRPDEDMAELAELKTRLLFGDMQGLGIKPPTHSASGLPKKKSQHGYAAVYDHLKQKGYFNHKKNGKQPAENGKEKPKREPMPPHQFKAKVAQNLREQSEGRSEKMQKAENGKRAAQAAEISPERAEAITQQTRVGLSFVGLSEEDTAEQVERFPVWKYLPRCGKCGQWMSTQNPVCNNPKCGMAGQQQGEPVPWPPPGATFKRSRIQSRMSETGQLPPSSDAAKAQVEEDEAVIPVANLSPEEEAEVIREAMAQDIAGVVSAYQDFGDGEETTIEGADEELQAQIMAEGVRQNAQKVFVDKWLQAHPDATEAEALRAFEEGMRAFDDPAGLARMERMAALSDQFLLDHPDADEAEIRDYVFANLAAEGNTGEAAPQPEEDDFL